MIYGTLVFLQNKIHLRTLLSQEIPADYNKTQNSVSRLIIKVVAVCLKDQNDIILISPDSLITK